MGPELSGPPPTPPSCPPDPSHGGSLSRGPRGLRVPPEVSEGPWGPRCSGPTGRLGVWQGPVPHAWSDRCWQRGPSHWAGPVRLPSGSLSSRAGPSSALLRGRPGPGSRGPQPACAPSPVPAALEPPLPAGAWLCIGTCSHAPVPRSRWAAAAVSAPGRVVGVAAPSKCGSRVAPRPPRCSGPSSAEGPALRRGQVRKIKCHFSCLLEMEISLLSSWKDAHPTTQLSAHLNRATRRKFALEFKPLICNYLGNGF